MGYYTQYSLGVLQGKDTNIDYQKEICDMVDYEYLFDEQTKWYKHDEDMKTISRKYPKVLFVLHGVGDDYGDIWRAYYYDGECKERIEAEIVFKEFDLSKVK
jgi:hypothetical protein